MILFALVFFSGGLGCGVLVVSPLLRGLEWNVPAVPPRLRLLLLGGTLR